MAAADDEAEVPGARDAEEARRGLARERLDHVDLCGGVLGRRSAERGAQLRECRRRADGSLIELGALCDDELAHAPEQLVERHSANRRFNSKMASIGPGSTSFSSAR
jgi:hypothetical protein